VIWENGPGTRRAQAEVEPIKTVLLNFKIDDNGTLLVTCPTLPEVTTFGDDENDARRRGAEAVEEALAARAALKRPTKMRKRR
jgi:predicted RNase H-like HicB family nuclease